MRQRREVSAHDLPLPTLFDKDQGGSPVDGLHLAILGHSRKRIVGIHNPGVVVKNAARRLAKAKIHRGDALDCSSQKSGELRLIVKPVGNVIKDLQVIGEHVQGGFEVLLVKRVTKLLSQSLNLLCAHRYSSFLVELLLCLCFIPVYSSRRKKSLSTTAWIPKTCLGSSRIRAGCLSVGVSIEDKIFLAPGRELGNTIHYEVSIGA